MSQHASLWISDWLVDVLCVCLGREKQQQKSVFTLTKITIIQTADTKEVLESNEGL